MRGRQQLGADGLRVRCLEGGRAHAQLRAGQYGQGRGVTEAVNELRSERRRPVEGRDRKLEKVTTRDALRARDRGRERRDRERESQVAHALRQYATALTTSRKRFPLSDGRCRFLSFSPEFVERPCCWLSCSPWTESGSRSA